MSVTYKAINWGRQKRIYDATAAAGLVLAMGGFALASALVRPGITIETLLIRASALGALLLLHVILIIGPLARLNPKFLPALFNRRHLGVAMFLLALVHAGLCVVQFHAAGDANPITSVFTAYSHDYRAGPAHFPFEPFGAAALLILFLMAATSHDFWLKTLGSSVWKSLHMLVYLAYGLVVVHVVFGAMQSERSSVYPFAMAAGAALVLGLHLAAAVKEVRADTRAAKPADGFLEACAVSELTEGRGKSVRLGEERVAVFLHHGRVFALGNVCRHQGGPIGEGKILEGGCITCPWHGWEYRPEDGCSPPPFHEILPTYNARVENGRVLVDPTPNPLKTVCPGAAAEAFFPPPAAPKSDDEFYVGYLPSCPPGIARLVRRFALAVVALAPAVALLFAGSQNRFDEGRFEFGRVQSFSGFLFSEPLPFLRTSGAGDAAYLLVGRGKHAVPERIMRFGDGPVSLTGKLIERRGMKMIEVADGAPVAHSRGRVRPEARAKSLGRATLVGELVDTKCFLGVMRPATGKVHRACAVRCLSGGVPPGLLVRGADGEASVILLSGRGGRPLEFDFQLAGRLVAASGELESNGNTLVLKAESLLLADDSAAEVSPKEGR